jgi:chromosome segregation ATPase
MSSFDSSSGSASNMPFPSDAEVTDQVFITPRVLDQGAFREYTDSLKGLIREAGGRRNELRTDAEDARQLGENLSEAANRLRERLETTAKLLPALDNRVRRAEAIMAQATDDAQLPEQIEKRIGAYFEQMEARIAERIKDAEARLEVVERRYTELHVEAQTDIAHLESLQTDLSESASSTRADLEAISRQTASIETVSQALAEQARGIPAKIEQQLTGAVEAMDRHAEETIKRVRAIEMLSERAVRLLGFDPDDPGDEIAPDSLMMLVQRGDELERTARAAAAELHALHQTNDQVQARLTETVEGAHGSIEALTHRRDELVSSMEEALAEFARSRPEVLENLVQVREQIAEIEHRREQVEAGMLDISGELGKLEDEVTERLEAMRVQATKELSRLQVAVAAQRRSLSEIAGPETGKTQPQVHGEPGTCSEAEGGETDS